MHISASLRLSEFVVFAFLYLSISLEANFYGILLEYNR